MLPYDVLVTLTLFNLSDRGSDFRFSHLAEIWSIVPKDVNVMALTATVSPLSMQAILDKLGMTKKNTCIMRELPNKLNIINKIL